MLKRTYVDDEVMRARRPVLGGVFKAVVAALARFYLDAFRPFLSRRVSGRSYLDTFRAVPRQERPETCLVIIIFGKSAFSTPGNSEIT